MNIRIDRHLNIKLIDQIFNQIESNIATGALKEDAQLPSIRKFSKENNVSHVTVSKAYKKLEKKGLIKLIHGKGAFVKSNSNMINEQNIDNIPSHSDSQLNFKNYVNSPPYVRNTNRDIRFNFSEAVINPRLLPSDYLAEQVNQLLLDNPKTISSYSSVQGEIDVRESIQSYICRNEKFSSTISTMIITSGVQQGIDIIAKTFIGPGDIVITEEVTYFHALEVFANRGAKIISAPIDEDGIKIDELATLCSKYSPKLIYIIPTFHNPTGITLSLVRRIQLLDLAKKYKFLIIEDDSWNDIYFDDVVPPPAIKSLDQESYVIYLKGFSKYLSPGCRVGVILSNKTTYPHLLASKTFTDLGSPILTQKAASSFLNSTRMNDHLIKLRTALELRRNQFISLLEEHLPKNVQWNEPIGGLNIWITLPKGTDTDQLLEESLNSGISFFPGSLCCVDEKKSRHLRISFSYIDTLDINDGVIKLCKVITNYLNRLK
jgi:DNA-binding transcriptional MocR family regulator